jgi:hypothetical protein
MTPRTCAHQRELEALFIDGEAPGEIGTHLADCTSCKELYDRLALAGRALEATELSSFEIAFAQAAIFDALEDDRSASILPLQKHSEVRGPRYLRYAAAAVVAIIGSATLYLASQAPTEPDEFQARSAVTLATSEHPRPTLELFCVDRDHADVTFRGTLDTPFGALSCPLEAELKLAYTNPDPRLTHAAFFGISNTGKLYWYGPSPADGAPVQIVATNELEPAGESIRLAVNHTPGLVRVHGVFSSHPIDFKALSTMVQKIPASQRYEATVLDPWLDGARSTSRTFEIVKETTGDTP